MGAEDNEQGGVDDEELEIERRFLQGDEGAFEYVFKKHLLPLEKYLYSFKGMSYIHDRGDLASTTASDALLIAFNSREEFDPSRNAKLSTWIYDRAKNMLRDEMKKRMRQSNALQKKHPAWQGDSYTPLFDFGPPAEEDRAYIPRTRKERIERLDISGLDKSVRRLFGHIVAYDWGHATKRTLSPREWKIIALANKFTPKKEIARRLGMSTAAADVAISKIIKKLQAKV